jgi:hypothetical protein
MGNGGVYKEGIGKDIVGEQFDKYFENTLSIRDVAI